jgi:hypothetical protein
MKNLLDNLKGAEQCITKALPHLPPDTLAVHCGEWLADIREALKHPNVGLIVAAPDMLYVLDWLVQEYEEGDGIIPDGLYTAARKATLKARA